MAHVLATLKVLEPIDEAQSGLTAITKEPLETVRPQGITLTCCHSPPTRNHSLPLPLAVRNDKTALKSKGHMSQRFLLQTPLVARPGGDPLHLKV